MGKNRLFHIHKKFEEAKQHIEAATNADEMIERCLICHDRKAQIVAHHPNVKNPAEALKDILKCGQCRPILFAITTCAKQGHIISEVKT